MEVIEDAGPVVDRGMPHVHQHVGDGEGGKGQVAGPVTGVSAHDDLETGPAEGEGEIRGPAFEPLGELEGDDPRPPSAEIRDEPREIFQ